MAVGNRIVYFGGADSERNRYSDLHILTVAPGNRLTWARFKEPGAGRDWPGGGILDYLNCMWSALRAALRKALYVGWFPHKHCDWF